MDNLWISSLQARPGQAGLDARVVDNSVANPVDKLPALGLAATRPPTDLLAWLTPPWAGLVGWWGARLTDWRVKGRSAGLLLAGGLLGG